MDEYNDNNTTSVEVYEDAAVQEHNSLFRIIFYITAAIVFAAGLYVAWLYVSSDKDWGFDIKWKFWESTFLWPALSVIGFFLQFIDWQHTSFKEGWVVKDSWGRERFVENNDIMSTLWGGCLFPLIAHLLLIPCAYGAVLYYFIILPLALVNAIIPYLAAAICVVLAVLFFLFSRNFEWKSKSLFKLVVSTIACLLLLWLISIPTNADFSFGSDKASTSSANLPPAIGQVTVTTKVANLRTGPGTNYDFYKRANGAKLQSFMNDRLSVVEDQGEWYKVLTNDGGLAYIKKTLCSPMESEAATTEEAPDFADDGNAPDAEFEDVVPEVQPEDNEAEPEDNYGGPDKDVIEEVADSSFAE